MSDTHQGGCLCGQLRYKVSGKPTIVAHCHCRDCQRSSGAGHISGAQFHRDGFSLTGTAATYTKTSGMDTQVTRVFCAQCGSTIHDQNDGMPNHVMVLLGTLDDPSVFTPTVRVYTRSQPTWDVMDEEMYAHPTQPPWKPER
ncbi:MAG: GFA family protein [Cohaesibacteraceae bacterium]|nr:GFA family protein [Cohaesibacteraceae bacterium]